MTPKNGEVDRPENVVGPACSQQIRTLLGSGWSVASKTSKVKALRTDQRR
jgi:hypothetical protein